MKSDDDMVTASASASRSGRDVFLLVAPLVAALAGFLIFCGALGYDFVYDDHVDIKEYDLVFEPGAWLKIFYSASAQLYRPVLYVSHHFDNAIWGWDPKGFHFTSLLLHAICCAMTFFFLLELKVSRIAAAAGALWFALHPIHTESVVWISSRNSMLSAIGVMGCFIMYAQWRESGKLWRFIGVGLFGVYAFFSREDALMVIPALVVAEYWIFQPGGLRGVFQKRMISAVAVLLALAVFYFVVRQNLLTGVEQGAWENGFIGLVATLPVILVRYIGQLVYPLTLTVDQPVNYAAGFDGPFWLSVAALLLMGLLILIGSRRTARVKFAATWFFLYLVPVMGVIPINQPMADRFQYLPSLAGAFCVCLVFDVASAWKPVWRKVSLGLFVLMLVAYGHRSVTYAATWKDDQTLWEYTVLVNPNAYRAYSNLAAQANKRGDYMHALALVDVGLDLHPNSPDAFVIKAYALDRLGRTDEAEALYRKAIDYDNAYPIWYFLLADMLERASRQDDAEAVYDALFEVRPGYVDARVAAGVLAAQMGKMDRAIMHWETALKYNPADEMARQNLTIARKSQQTSSN